MRWLEPANYERRVRSGFLLFPKTCKNEAVDRYETRWLSWESWEQLYFSYGWTSVYWRDTKKDKDTKSNVIKMVIR